MAAVAADNDDGDDGHFANRFHRIALRPGLAAHLKGLATALVGSFAIIIIIIIIKEEICLVWLIWPHSLLPRTASGEVNNQSRAK